MVRISSAPDSVQKNFFDPCKTVEDLLGEGDIRERVRDRQMEMRVIFRSIIKLSLLLDHFPYQPLKPTHQEECGE